MSSNLKLGIYQHYKGNKYLALCVAKHSETLEEMVVYVSLYDNKTSHTWIRPLSMFTEIIEKEGKKIARFKYVGAY